ncbi:MAG TPA: polysaccharide deacetylase family protein [Planctomycetota bacterium]|nr:polysaccharide deacetylase family protein [Planctomycetota bacterium]
MPAFVKRGLRTGADRAARVSGVLARRERRGADGLTVLTYHRVLPHEACAGYPFPALVMPLEAFRQQVGWLAAHGDVLPLSEALARRAQGCGRRLFALTFDDGYHDSGEIVAGVLEQAGVRGTFYVTAGFVGSDELLWFDRSALLFAAAPERLRHEVVRHVCGDGRRDERPPPGADGAAWTGFLKGCGPAERGTILAGLERAAGVPAQARDFRAMRVEQVVDLHRSGHEIGCHTVSHAMLPQLDDVELRRELEDSRDALANWIGEPVAGFCYPNGDHDDRSVAAVARAGYSHACTTRNGIHRPGDDPFRIRRIEIAPGRVLERAGRLDVTAFRRELCGLFRRSPAGSYEGA